MNTTWQDHKGRAAEIFPTKNTGVGDPEAFFQTHHSGLESQDVQEVYQIRRVVQDQPDPEIIPFLIGKTGAKRDGADVVQKSAHDRQ